MCQSGKQVTRVVLAAVLAAAPGCGRHATETHRADPTSTRVTPSGTVVGFVNAYGSHAWLGIPFATAPVEALRWRAPQPPEPWPGVRQALAFGSPCTQYASPLAGIDGSKPGTILGSEDCLYLNVFAPRANTAAAPPLPVMLWIHGGGNSIGQAGFYDGGNLAATQQVVVVTTNYRLGPFGWFRHAAVRGDTSNGVDQSGNFGTLDLVRALEWVRDNISAFGGDPGNVTIFGESAGGTNVFSLLLSPQTHGLFHRAIVQSGGLRMTDVATAENFADDVPPGAASSSNEVLLRLLIADGHGSDRATARAHLGAMPRDDVDRYLRSKSSTQILSAYTPMPGFGMVDMPQVFRDGAVLPPQEPLQRFADGEYNRVPVVLGTNRDENKLFMFGEPARVRKLFWVLPRVRNTRQYDLSAEYLAKMWKAIGADEPAAAMRAVQGPSVYVYRFDWDEEPRVLGSDLSQLLGAAHGFEIPFVFGHFDLGREGNVIFTTANEPGRKTLSAQMMSYWAAFAARGSPGHGSEGSLPDWQPWENTSGATPAFMVFDTPAGGGVRLSTDTVTRRIVLAAVDADPRLPTQRDKCIIYRELANAGRGFSKKDYATAGKQGCAEYPFDEYPWQ